MKTGQVKDISRQAADRGRLHVRLTNGEPLLSMGFVELHTCNVLDLRNRRDDAGKNAAIEPLQLSPQEALEVLTRDAARYN